MKKKLICAFTCILFLLLFSCGLDVYYFVEPPFNSVEIFNPPDETFQVFSFTTADSRNTDPSVVGQTVYFLGTDVYYKIYTDLSVLESHKKSINSANAEYTENGINKLNSLGFQKITSNPYSDPLIRKSASNQNVKIRLFDTSVYKSKIEVSGVDKGIPLRYDGSSFNIQSGEILDGLDINGNPNSDSNYYVLMYAVSVSTVNLSQRIYSSLCPLGYLQLK